MSNELADRLVQEADEITCYASTITEYRPNGTAKLLREAATELARLREGIEEHNKGCLEACGKTTSHDYVRKQRQCDSRRDCPDCPKDWMIDDVLDKRR